MKVYVPLIAFKLHKEESNDVCDYILNGFSSQEDAKLVYPDDKIVEIEIPDGEDVDVN